MHIAWSDQSLDCCTHESGVGEGKQITSTFQIWLSWLKWPLVATVDLVPSCNPGIATSLEGRAVPGLQWNAELWQHEAGRSGRGQNGNPGIAGAWHLNKPSVVSYTHSRLLWRDSWSEELNFQASFPLAPFTFEIKVLLWLLNDSKTINTDIWRKETFNYNSTQCQSSKYIKKWNTVVSI